MSSKSFKSNLKPLTNEIPALREFQLNIEDRENMNLEKSDNRLRHHREDEDKIPKAHNHLISSSNYARAQQKEQNLDQESQMQTLFLTLTSQLTGLSSKITTILERVDNLEASLPQNKENNNNTLSLSEFCDSLPMKNDPNEKRFENELGDKVTKLNSLYESLTARLTLLETEVLILKEVINFFLGKN